MWSGTCGAAGENTPPPGHPSSLCPLEILSPRREESASGLTFSQWMTITVVWLLTYVSMILKLTLSCLTTRSPTEFPISKVIYCHSSLLTATQFHCSFPLPKSYPSFSILKQLKLLWDHNFNHPTHNCLLASHLTCAIIPIPVIRKTYRDL